MPVISVLLPVYNGKPYLRESIESVLSQTYEDFELIIVDDGSTDSSGDVVASFSDSRIRYFYQANRGLAYTLNVAISKAQARYLARQDQDDLSLPTRFAKQVAFMDDHPDCGLLGTWAQIMEVDKLSDRYHRHPLAASALRYELLFNNPFVHSSVMLRREVVQRLGGYTTDLERQPPEDYEFWSRIARNAEIANLPEVLLIYREIPTSMSRTGVSPFQKCLIHICAENLAHASRVPLDDPAVRAIAALTHGSLQMVERPPDFRRMRTILVTAFDHCNTLQQQDPQVLPAADAEARVANLRASWLAYRTPLASVLQRQGPLRALAKKILTAWRRLVLR